MPCCRQTDFTVYDVCYVKCGPQPALTDAHQTIEDAQIIRLSVDVPHRFAGASPKTLLVPMTVKLELESQ
jgi:hypothetical protein